MIVNQRLIPCRCLTMLPLSISPPSAVINQRLTPCRCLAMLHISVSPPGAVINQRLIPCRRLAALPLSVSPPDAVAPHPPSPRLPPSLHSPYTTSTDQSHPHHLYHAGRNRCSEQKKKLAHYTSQNADTQQQIYDTEVRIKNTFTVTNQDVTTQLKDHELN